MVDNNHTAACQLGAECECRPARFDSITDLSLELDSFSSLEFEFPASFDGFLGYAWQYYTDHPVFDRDLLFGLYLRQVGLRPVDYLDSHVHGLLFEDAINGDTLNEYETFVWDGLRKDVGFDPTVDKSTPFFYTESKLTERCRIGISMLVLRKLIEVKRFPNEILWRVKFTAAGRQRIEKRG